MIQLTGRQQFGNAAERAPKARQHVRRYEPGVYGVTNRAKAHSYLVRFERVGSNVFGTCACGAGVPSRERRPQVCKHLFAAVVTHCWCAPCSALPSTATASWSRSSMWRASNVGRGPGAISAHRCRPEASQQRGATCRGGATPWVGEPVRVVAPSKS